MIGENLTALRRKHGFSQQEVADMLSVTRQTISNWECNQGAPALDKAAELARIYKVSLDALVGNQIESTAKEEKKKDMHLLKSLTGKTVNLECNDWSMFIDGVRMDKAAQGSVKVLDVNGEWIRVEYTRTKQNSLLQKETVVSLIGLPAIDGIEIVEVSD